MADTEAINQVNLQAAVEAANGMVLAISGEGKASITSRIVHPRPPDIESDLPYGKQCSTIVQKQMCGILNL